MTRLGEMVVNKPDIVGKRIELVRINDLFTKLQAGDRGTVTMVDSMPFTDTPWQISVKWDDSESSLMLLEGIDQYRVLED